MSPRTPSSTTSSARSPSLHSPKSRSPGVRKSRQPVHQRQVQRAVVQAVHAVAIVPSVLADHAAQQSALHEMAGYQPSAMQMDMAPAAAPNPSGKTAQQHQLERQRLLEQDATSALDLPANFAMDVPHAPSQPLLDAAAAAFGADVLDDETTAGEECWAEQVMSSDWLSSFEHQASVL